LLGGAHDSVTLTREAPIIASNEQARRGAENVEICP
jgi:hypothetical protein